MENGIPNPERSEAAIGSLVCSGKAFRREVIQRGVKIQESGKRANHSVRVRSKPTMRLKEDLETSYNVEGFLRQYQIRIVPFF